MSQDIKIKMESDEENPKSITENPESNKRNMIIAICTGTLILLLGGLGVFLYGSKMNQLHYSKATSNQYLFMNRQDEGFENKCFQIFTFNLDDKSEQQITRREMFEDGDIHFYNTLVDVSWDGQYVLFNRENGREDNKFYIMKRDGTELRSLGTGKSHCFSPDGKHVAWVSHKNNDTIFIENIIDKNDPIIVNNTFPDDFTYNSIQFTSNGKYLFYVVYQPKQKSLAYLKEINSDKKAEYIAYSNEIDSNNIQISPDGKKIMFKDLKTGYLYINDINGKNEKLLDNENYHFFKWSRDGKRVLLKSDKGTKIMKFDSKKSELNDPRIIEFMEEPITVNW